MMTKYEIIEAKNIFNLNYNQISILTHPHHIFTDNKI